MSRFLFTNMWTDDLGLPMRTVPIARELKRRGHDVAFCNPMKAPSEVIKDAGLANIAPEIHKAFPSKFAPMTPEIWNMNHFFSMVPASCLDEDFVRDGIQAIVKIVNSFGPDAVVDSWNPSAWVASRVTGRPLMTVIQADQHPANRGFIWWRDTPADVPTPVPVMNKILADYGLKSICDMAELLVGDVTLCVGIPETDPIPAGQSVTHIGPMIYRLADETLPAWIDEFRGDKPLIWVYAGNPRYAAGLGIAVYADSIVVLRTAVEALSTEDVRVIMTTGHHSLPDELSRLPGNFRCEPFLPGIPLAEKSNLIIHHGGHGSCMTSLYAGTPTVVIPTYSERESNARRLCSLGVAEMLLPTVEASGEKRLSADDLRTKVRQVLSDKSFAQRSAKLSEKARKYDGVNRAADMAEDLSRRC